MIQRHNELYEQYRTEKLRLIHRDMTSSIAGTNYHETESMSSNIDYSNELSSFSESQIPIKARVLHYPITTKIKHLKSIMYDKFVSITGTVVRVSNAQPFCIRMAFECGKCGSSFVNFYSFISLY